MRAYPSRFRNLRISTRLTVSIAAVILLAIFSVAALNIRRERRYFFHELEDQALLLLDTLEIAIGDAVYFHDTDHISDTMEALDAGSIISAGKVYSEKGRVIAHSTYSPGAFDFSVDDFGLEILAQSDVLFRWEDTSLLAGKPIRAGRTTLGAISIELPTAPLYEEISQVRRSVLIFAPIMVFVGVLIAFVLGRSISTPLKHISEVTREIAEGDLTRKVNVSGASEFVSLANTFNQMVDRVRSARDNLEQRVAERTSDLAKAAKQAEAASAAKTAFLANVSHELRTPLNHIIGFSGLIGDKQVGDLNDAQREYLEDIQSSSEHLLNLINGVLDLSKVEAGKTELDITRFSAKDLIEESLKMIREDAAAKGIAVSADIQSLPVTIEADRQKIRQVLINVLGNSLKFTNSGGEVHVKAGLDVKHSEMSITISDTGIGLNQEDTERIFRAFEQVTGASNDSRKGTGLGLPLSREFVKLHNGRIWAESEGVNKGTTIHIAIPV